MADKKADGGPAFPTPTPYADGGMTLRDYFAAKALAGIMANPSWNAIALMASGVPDDRVFAVAAGMSFAYADAMLAERTKS